MDRFYFVVVQRGKASALLKKAEKYGVTKSTIFLGDAFLHNRIIDKLGITNTHKEILLFSISGEQRDALFSQNRLFLKKNKSLIFSIPFIQRHLNNADTYDAHIPESKTDAKAPVPASDEPYFCIMTIVDTGHGETCAKIGHSMGALASTIIHCHGAGIPKDFFVSLAIEPQKEMVMTFAKKENLGAIQNRITKDLHLEQAGKGIIFILPVTSYEGYF